MTKLILIQKNVENVAWKKVMNNDNIKWKTVFDANVFDTQNEIWKIQKNRIFFKSHFLEYVKQTSHFKFEKFFLPSKKLWPFIIIFLLSLPIHTKDRMFKCIAIHIILHDI